MESRRRSRRGRTEDSGWLAQHSTAAEQQQTVCLVSYTLLDREFFFSMY